ncbi:MAG: deoxyribonuclease IV [Candidatus Neomarinimicrobiota bacterium]
MGLLGAHVSVAGGVFKAPARGTDISADSIQIFTANQNQWFPKQPSEDDASRFRHHMHHDRPDVCVSHASFLLNLGSPEEEKLAMSRNAFMTEIDRCDACEIPYVIFHPGAHKKTGEEKCLTRIAESINVCLDKRPGSKVTILIENTAGQGSAVGYTFEHLISIMDQVKHRDRVGVCFDTQHAFAAGYDIRTEKGWNETFDHFDRTVGLERLKAFHINDSKKELGQRVDRHENLGKGFLTRKTFWCLVNDDRFEHLPMILETPADDPTVYAGELDWLRRLVGTRRPD